MTKTRLSTQRPKKNDVIFYVSFILLVLSCLFLLFVLTNKPQPSYVGEVNVIELGPLHSEQPTTNTDPSQIGKATGTVAVEGYNSAF